MYNDDKEPVDPTMGETDDVATPTPEEVEDEAGDEVVAGDIPGGETPVPEIPEEPAEVGAVDETGEVGEVDEVIPDAEGGYDNIDAMAEMVPDDANAPVSAYGGVDAGSSAGCVSMNPELFIRLLELAHEGLAPGEEGDVSLHKISEAVSNLCVSQGTLSMDNYEDIKAAAECEECGQMGGDMVGDGEAEMAADEAEEAGETPEFAAGEEEGEIEAETGDEEGEEHEAAETPEFEAGEEEGEEEAEEEEGEEGEEEGEEAEEGEEEGEEAEEEEGEKEEKKESGKPPWESIRKISDPIMEEIARRSYLGAPCVSTRGCEWEEAAKILSEGWDDGYRMLIIDGGVVLREDTKIPSGIAENISVFRPKSKRDMIEAAYGKWFSSFDEGITYNDVPK